MQTFILKPIEKLYLVCFPSSFKHTYSWILRQFNDSVIDLLDLGNIQTVRTWKKNLYIIAYAFSIELLEAQPTSTLGL